MNFSSPARIRLSDKTTAALLRSALCLVVLATAAAPAEAWPQDVSPDGNAGGYTLDQHISYYLVTGDDANAVRRSLARLGSLGTDGKRYDGYTKWDVHWEYAAQSEASGDCAVASSSVVLSVDMTLPQWQPSSDVTDSLQKHWSVYLAALRAHEDGHVQNAKMEATAIAQLLQTIEPQSDCDLLDQKLQDLGRQILQHYKDFDVEYDQRTEHGRTQGAVFP